MKATERRKEIVTILLADKNAVSGSTLAERLGVSRQIIVQDIALLKASGYDGGLIAELFDYGDTLKGIKESIAWINETWAAV